MSAFRIHRKGLFSGTLRFARVSRGRFSRLSEPRLIALACRSLALCVLAGQMAARAGMPEDHEVVRYEVIWKASPFVAAAVVSPQAESIAQRYAITGFARMGEREVVFVFDRKALARFPIWKNEEQNGVELLSVTEGADAKGLGAQIRASGEVAKISYDASLAASPGQPGDAKPVHPVPAVPPQNVSVQPPQPAQGTQTRATPTVQAGGPNSGPKPTRVIRRRDIPVK